MNEPKCKKITIRRYLTVTNIMAYYDTEIITSYDATIFSLTALSILTFSIMLLFVTLSIKDSQHNDTLLKHTSSLC
jgi:hypothetical protein